MRQRILMRATLASIVGIGLILASSVLPGCGGGDDGASAVKAADAANPGVTKASQAEKTGLVGPKGKRAGATP